MNLSPFNGRLFCVLLLTCLAACQNKTGESVGMNLEGSELADQTIPVKYGIETRGYALVEGSFQKNQFLADLLLNHGIGYDRIVQLERNTREVFDIRKIKPGDAYTLFCTKDSLQSLVYMVLETSVSTFVTYHFSDGVTATLGTKPIEILYRSAVGEINSSLSQTVSELGVNPELANRLSEIYAWSIDFYRLQKGDWFKVYYEEKYIDGKSIGVGKILAAEFWHRDKGFEAFRFHRDEVDDFFDGSGESLRKAFLKSPLKFSTISSRYSLKRFHPVQKRWKAHLGTDYAAPTGTAILATANGIVEESSHGKYNGNYVKIRHNSTYTTQYLHMSKRAAKKGQAVKQGEVIGYVGSTGLATGPHVCYRFWKNGKQVDPYKEELPKSESLPAAYMPAFQTLRDSLKTILNDLPKPGQPSNQMNISI